VRHYRRFSPDRSFYYPAWHWLGRAQRHACPTANPKGAVSASELFAAGSPDGSKSGKRMKNKDSMSKGHGHSKMKAKAE